jgi:hypothetical protein
MIYLLTLLLISEQDINVTHMKVVVRHPIESVLISLFTGF